VFCYRQYAKGKLDNQAFLKCCLLLLTDNDTEILNSPYQEFTDKHIKLIMTRGGENLITRHKLADAEFYVLLSARQALL
jgi:hypothetical protein